MVANRGKKPRTAVDEEPGRIDVLCAIEKLQDLQDDLEKVNEEAHEKILAFEQKYNEMREPVYKKRNEIISSIPDFWLTAFLNHPTLGTLLTDEDQKIFRYLDYLIVEDFKDPRKGYCITFNFKANPYFENAKLSKTINFSDEGIMGSIGTTIDWKEGKAPAEEKNITKGNKRLLPWDSFFSWFGCPKEEKPEVEQDLVADIIKEEIWPNPIEHLNNDDDEDDEDEDDEGEEDDDEEEEDDDDSSGNDEA